MLNMMAKIILVLIAMALVIKPAFIVMALEENISEHILNKPHLFWDVAFSLFKIINSK